MEQNSNDIQIIGEAYRYDNRSYFAKWKSDGNVSIDSSKSSLSFMYTFDLLGRDSKYTGFADFDLLEKDTFKTPKRINGYYFTLKSKQKTKSTFIKIFDGSSAKCKYKTEDLIQKAHVVGQNRCQSILSDNNHKIERFESRLKTLDFMVAHHLSTRLELAEQSDIDYARQ